jgi:hypothetical protein
MPQHHYEPSAPEMKHLRIALSSDDDAAPVTFFQSPDMTRLTEDEANEKANQLNAKLEDSVKPF